MRTPLEGVCCKKETSFTWNIWQLHLEFFGKKAQSSTPNTPLGETLRKWLQFCCLEEKVLLSFVFGRDYCVSSLTNKKSFTKRKKKLQWNTHLLDTKTKNLIIINASGMSDRCLMMYSFRNKISCGVALLTVLSSTRIRKQLLYTAENCQSNLKSTQSWFCCFIKQKRGAVIDCWIV